MDRVNRPNRIVAFWRTLLGVQPLMVLIAIGKVVLGVLAIPVVIPIALVCSVIWAFYLLGNKITKSLIAAIEQRYVE